MRTQITMSRAARLRILLVSLLPLGALLSLLASRFPWAVEAAYAGGLYPVVARSLSRLTGWVPFSVAEAAAALVSLWILWRLAKLFRAALPRLRGRPDGSGKPLGRSLARTLATAAAVIATCYFLFLGAWGLNYHRPPFAALARLDTRGTTGAELESLCRDLVARTSSLREEVAEDAGGAMRLEGGQDGALSRAGIGYLAAGFVHPQLAGAYGPPKPVLLSSVLSFLGVSGIYFPFTGEANINRTLPDSMLPFTACHELAHQHGFAREDEANYLAYLACRLHPDADYRYSGHLAATLYALSALPDSALREEIAAELGAGVQRDIEARKEWRERYRTPLAPLVERVNDAYLRANGQWDGARSYGRMVDLLVAERRPRR
jgi:hypothetical protein